MELNPFALKLYPLSYQDFQLSIYSHSAATIQFHLRLIEHRRPAILFTSAKILLHPVFLDIPRHGVHTVYRTSFTSQSHMTLLRQCNKGSNHRGNQTHLKNLLQQSISIYLFIYSYLCHLKIQTWGITTEILQIFRLYSIEQIKVLSAHPSKGNEGHCLSSSQSSWECFCM